MYGEPDPLAAYSLSGHIVVTLSSGFSLLERKRIVHVLLQSLAISFEGQTELVTEETGYSAFRLCSVTKDLVLEEPVELTNEGEDGAAAFSVWNVVFSLAIPGWLPASAAFGDSGAGTRYALYASAALENIDDGSPKSWLSAFCSPFQSPFRTVKACLPIELHRYVSPSMVASSSTSAFPTAHFAVKAQGSPDDEQSAIPRDVLSKILVQVSVPERIALEEDTIPFSIRLRTDGLPQSECAKLRATSFHVDVEQIERYRTVPNSAYTTQFPVPPSSEQPPNRPLRRPHPVHALYRVGIAPKRQEEQVLCRSFSLLPDDVSGQYKVAGDGYIFKHDAEEEDWERTWFSLSTSVPISCSNGLSTFNDWKYERSKRPSADSPFLGVSHRLYVTLTCTYDADDGETQDQVTQHLRFHIPLRFVFTPPAPPTKSPTPSLMGDTISLPDSAISVIHSSGLLDLPLPSVPYAPQTLPAYSQLFYANGDRKIDYSVPLPRYTPHPSDTDLTILTSESTLQPETLQDNM
ncbi:hypothetical protein NM688_g5327 [Phlebia brevispora]|uniref:Uncharacterized protein n=1 Tax=Phlebia brevispora TaxID=194682 RepID=A0ACC1SX98_9APHY|nr:hypothetical protein NM688_g5327 [Phlebia brevispora]